jgi:hypothetical protein
VRSAAFDELFQQFQNPSGYDPRRFVVQSQNTPSDRAGGPTRILTADDVRAVLTVVATALAADHACSSCWSRVTTWQRRLSSTWTPYASTTASSSTAKGERIHLPYLKLPRHPEFDR